jgi:processive 1,2-diacylglycerol beta-glucosyltransferase
MAVDRSPRLSILSCRYGEGHRRVGEAVAAEWRRRTGGAAEVIDYFARFVHPWYSALGARAYVETVRHLPVLYGVSYRATDVIHPESRLQRVINSVGMGRLLAYLETERPAVVCCVHCTTAGTMSDLRAAGRTRIPCLTVITDYDTHAQWIHPRVDEYCVPAEWVRRGLVSRGIAPERITVTGLPVARKFLRPLDRPRLMADLGLVPGRPVVLVIAGAYSMMSGLMDIVRVLAGDPRPLQAIVVCGHDVRLAAQVRAFAAGSGDRFRVFGYVNNVERLMAVSDLMITKAGAVTVSEALVLGLPMVIYRPIPGQEESNTRYLLEHGAALAPRRPAALRQVMAMLLSDPLALEAMRRAARAIARPRAARDVVDRLSALACGSSDRAAALLASTAVFSTARPSAPTPEAACRP